MIDKINIYVPVQLLRSGIRAYPLWQLHSQLPSELVQKVSQPPFSMVHSSMSKRQKNTQSHTGGKNKIICICKEIVKCLALTNTFQSVFSRFVSCITGTLVAANHIDTFAVPAQSVTQLTFIDICERKKKSNSYTDFIF